MVVPISQTPRSSTATPTRSPLTSSRRFVRARCRARSPLVGSGPTNALRDDALRALIAHEHLVSEVVPDLLIDPRELRLESDLGDVPRPRQIDAIDALDGPGTRRDDDHAIGERDRLLEIVRHEHHRRARCRPQLEQLVLHERSGLDVERTERLVHEEDPRLVDERLREGRALSHAAGKLMGVIPLKTSEAHPFDPIAGTLLRLATVHPTKTRTRRDVVEHALPRKDRVRLEDVADVTAHRFHRCTADKNLTLARWLEARDESEGGRLPAPGRSDDRAELTVLNREIEIAQSRVCGPGGREETLGDMPELDRRRHRREPAGRRASRLAIRSFRSFWSFRSRCEGTYRSATCGRATTPACVPGALLPGGCHRRHRSCHHAKSVLAG